MKSLDLVMAMTNACFVVETSAKMKCPVDSGQLRNSITHEVRIDGKVGYVGTNVEYAPYIEFGTGIHSSLGNGRQTPWVYYDPRHKHGKNDSHFFYTVGQKPHPYLVPALNENRALIERVFSKTIEMAMKG